MMSPEPASQALRDPFDPAYAQQMAEQVLAPVLDHYFRPRIIGAERLPQQGPLILAANHSGNAFPYDAIVFDATLWRRSGFDPSLKLRSMYEKELSATWWMRPYGIDDFWRRAGSVDQTFANFDLLLTRGDRVVYYPEGVPGIGKGYFKRYQLQRFHTAFVVLAARHRAPVYPVYCVNAEWVSLPFTVTSKWINLLAQRVFRVPFFPLPWVAIPILLPWAWYLALPARMVFVIGEPIDVRALAAEAGVTDFDRPDHAVMQQLAEELRQRMQAGLNAALAKYGRSPYHVRSFWRELRKARGKLARILPPGWPAAFVRHDRDRQRPPAANRVTALLRDWDLAGFYLPFGWPLLSLTRAFRKPPCGYRGMSREQRRRKEGAFYWDLRESPLPPRKAPAGVPEPEAMPLPALPATPLVVKEEHPEYV